MNWKRLIEFALLGSSELEQDAILLIRLSRGDDRQHWPARRILLRGRTAQERCAEQMAA
jgi:hypothetical protein